MTELERLQEENARLKVALEKAYSISVGQVNTISVLNDTLERQMKLIVKQDKIIDKFTGAFRELGINI